MSSKIYDKGPGEKNLILGPREGLLWPFTAPSWTDLRLSAWLSITKAANDDDVTGLSETITAASARDRFWFGFKDSSNTFPDVSGSLFAGFAGSASSASLSSSGVNWLLTNSLVRVVENTTGNSTSLGNLALPFTGAAGYASPFSARISRPNSSSLAVTPQVNNNSSSYSSTPTIASLRAVTASTFGTSGTSASALTLSAVPTCIFIYWPFSNSRLRIHAIVIEKYAP